MEGPAEADGGVVVDARLTARRAVTYGLMPVVALAMTVALESGERLALAQAIDGIQDEFGVGDRGIGVLASAMAVVGVVGAVPFGLLADRVRRTRLLGGAMAAWTVGILASGLAPGFGALVVARLGVGVIEGNGPAAVSLVGDYYPVRRRANMFGLYQSGALAGGLLGVVVGGFVVGAHGWRWAFFMWVPLGVAVAAWVWTRPEPARGAQDDDLSITDAPLLSADPAVPLPADRVDPIEVLDLPPPSRVGTLDYRNAGTRQVVRELFRIRSMWLAVVAITLATLLLTGLQFWGVEFFKRTHALSAAWAGVVVALFGLGAAVGVLGGGLVSDRLLRRGMVNSRIAVISASSLAATVVLIPAFLLPSLLVATPLFVLGGLFLTMPVAPAEAMMNDVVVAALRGRAGSVRAILRSVAALGPWIVSELAEAIDLSTALALVTPLYAVGGLVVLLAARTYGEDLAFVAAETDRIRTLTEET